MSLSEEIARVREYQANPLKAPPNESCTCEWVIVPLLWKAGYKHHEIVSRASDTAGKFPDYTVLPSTSHTWYLEAKAWGVDLQDAHVIQAMNYAHTTGRRWVVLTNGQEWRLYDDHIQGVEAGQRLVADALLDSSCGLEQFLTALSKTSVLSGELDRYVVKSRLHAILNAQLSRPESEIIKAIGSALKNKFGLSGVQNMDIIAYFSETKIISAAVISATPAPISSSKPLPKGPSEQNYDPFSPPDVSHTRIQAKFGEETTSSWAELIQISIRAAVQAGYSLPELTQMLKANVREGVLKDNGFSHIPGTSLSVQGMEAKKSWRDAFALARKLGCVIEVSFRWYDTDTVPVERRGASGILRWSP